jgi:small subunit ribosomal protein S2
MFMISYQELVKAGVHYGHLAKYWCPKMAPYIWGYKNNIHLIDVSKTAAQIQKAAKFLEEVAAQNQVVMWVGTKKVAQDAVRASAEQFSHPFVTHRWIGGTLTNFPQVKKSVTKLLHLEDVLVKSDRGHYTKKELNTFQKNVDKLKKNVGGIIKFAWPVNALVVVDVRKERAAIREAARMGVPVIALVDTNSDPSFIDYVIPANDDSVSSIKVILNELSEAVARGAAKAREAEKQKQEVAAAQRAEKKAKSAAVATEKEAAQEAAAPAEGGEAKAEKKSAPRKPAPKAARPVKAETSDKK